MKTFLQNTTKFTASLLSVVMLLSVTFVSSSLGESKNKPWPAPDAAKKVKNPVAVDENSLKEGKEVYTKNCKSCHGVKGKGDGPKAENIEISCGDFSLAAFGQESDGAIYWKVTEGRKPMPSFKEKLNDHERWLVVNYIKTLIDKK